jgi:hypothetical protein
MKPITKTVLSLILCLLVANSAWALSSKNVVELKKAGLSDQTIQVIAREKVIETAAFSVEDIVGMKKAGVGEQTMQVILKNGSDSNRSKTVVYGRSTQTVRNISPEEIITLKEKGVSDEVLQSVIEASRSEDQDDRDRAWRMLENMDLEIHTRGQR